MEMATDRTSSCRWFRMSDGFAQVVTWPSSLTQVSYFTLVVSHVQRLFSHPHSLCLCCQVLRRASCTWRARRLSKHVHVLINICGIFPGFYENVATCCRLFIHKFASFSMLALPSLQHPLQYCYHTFFYCIFRLLRCRRSQVVRDVPLSLLHSLALYFSRFVSVWCSFSLWICHRRFSISLFFSSRHQRIEEKTKSSVDVIIYPDHVV